MSESKHTPGPWQAEQDDVPYDGGFETWVVNADGAGICMMDCPKDDMEVNARLIAAAPDLLKALESLNALIDFAVPCGDGDFSISDVSGLNRAFDLAHAAIAKAKGE